MRLLLRLQRGLISGTALALASCAAEPQGDADPLAATPGGPSSTGAGEEDRPLPAPAPGEGPIPEQKPTEKPKPG